MKISEAWLHDLVGHKLKGINIEEVLTQLGLEVDSVEPLRNVSHRNLVCCFIKEIQAHPKSDELKICLVETAGEKITSVVCGAKNVFTGAKAVLAPVGATLFKNEVVSKNVAGVESQGFLCSAEDLGLEERSEEIILLPQDCSINNDINEVLRLPDNIIDIDLTPNRGDCFSATGIARELCAFLDSAFKPEYSATKALRSPERSLSLEIEDKKGCPVYTVAILEGIKNNVILPIKINERLRRAGIQSINPVVDITNYVMLKTGQPLHAFDEMKASSESIKIRRARNAEKLKLLNEQNIVLDDDCLVIANDKEAIALAGIMGGLSSGVSPDTNAVILESAFFNPISIAKTARKFNIQTDASTRFERGVDPSLCPHALDEAIALITKCCGGRLIFRKVVSSDVHIPPKHMISFRPIKVSKTLGIEIPEANMRKILINLGFEIKIISEDLWEIKVPSFRFDIEIEMDIVEEIIRFFGVDKVPSILPSIKPKPSGINKYLDRERKIRTALSATGFSEIVSYSFVSSKFAKLFSEMELIKIKNPISKEMDMMRPTILSSMFSVILHNTSRQIDQMNLFEIGKVFFRKNGNYHENSMLAACRYGNVSRRHWCQEVRDSDFFDVKNDLVSLFSNCFGISLEFIAAKFNGFHPGQSATVNYQGQNVGKIGCLHPNLEKLYDINYPLYFFEINLSLFDFKSRQSFTPTSKYPSVSRDISIVIRSEITAAMCISEIEGLDLPLLKNLELFDVYKGQGIDPSKKSFSLGLIFQSSVGTLTDKEVDDSVDLIVNRLHDVFEAQLRE